MQKIDEESAIFIEWSQTQIDDPEKLEILLEEVINMFQDYFDGFSMLMIKSTLKEKQRLGALEYGKLQYDTDIIKKEIEAEFLDAVSWLLMKKYIEKKKKERK